LGHEASHDSIAYLFDIVIRYKTLRFILFIPFGLLLRFPPIVFDAFLENVKQITLAKFEFTFALGLVVVDRFVYPEEPHFGFKPPGERRLTRGAQDGYFPAVRTVWRGLEVTPSLYINVRASRPSVGVVKFERVV
jgi:hypothetical protein